MFAVSSFNLRSALSEPQRPAGPAGRRPIFLARARACCAALLLAGPATLAGAAPYALQAGAYSSLAQAQGAAYAWAQSCGPIRVASVQASTAGGGAGKISYKVWVGEFATYAEAWSAQQNLAPASELARAKVFVIDQAAVPAAIVATEGGTNRLPVEQPFDSEGLAAEDPAEAGAWWDEAGLGNGVAAGKLRPLPTRTALAGGAWRQAAVLAEVAEGPAAGAQFRLRLAREWKNEAGANGAAAKELLAHVAERGTPRQRVMARFIGGHALLAEGDRPAAIQAFRQVASTLNAPASLRREALRCAAGASHKAGDLPRAWQAFEEIALASSEAKAGAKATAAAARREAAEARMQQAGLAYELVLRGKGNWAEVRALCEAAAAEPGALRATRATAELMHLETYYHEREYGRGLAEAKAFVSTYADLPRERDMAGVWQGLCLYRLGENEQALQVLGATAEAAKNAAPADRFAGVSVRARCAVWLAWINHCLTQPEEARRWAAIVRQEFPSSSEEVRLLALIR